MSARLSRIVRLAQLALFLLMETLWVSEGQAQVPQITVITPGAIAPGQPSTVTVQGGGLDGVTGIWTTFAGQSALAPGEMNGKEAGKVDFVLTLPPDAPVGIHGVRVYSPRGVSNLKLFCVDDLPTIAEAAGNGTVKTPQEVAIPGAIDGVVDNLTRDFFKFKAEKGQLITVEVLARRLGSPLDASLYIYKENGTEIAYSDDAEGLSSDPQIAFKAPEAANYIVEVRDIRYAGSGNHRYRLRIGDFPAVQMALPVAVPRGQKSRIDFAGVSVDDAAPAWLETAADAAPGWRVVNSKRSGGKSSAFAYAELSATGEVVDHEPNDTVDQAQVLILGQQVSGRLDKTKDTDKYRIEAKAGQRFLFTGLTRSLAAPTDLILRILDAKGGQVAMADDEGKAEGKLNYAFPADGVYFLEVGELNKRGGSQYAYRVAVEEYRPGFKLAASADTLNVPAGGTIAVTVTTTRLDYGGAIDLQLTGLPVGLTSVPTRIGPGLNAAVLTVTAAKDAPAGALSHVQLVGKAKIGDRDFEAASDVEEALRGQWSGTRLVPPTVSRAMALGVAPAGKLALRTEPAEIIFGKELKATVKVIAERGEGIDEAITLATEPAQNALPGGIALAVKPIDKGQSEVVLEFTANDQAPLGPFTVVLVATHKKGNDTVIAHVPGIAYKTDAPFTVAVAGGNKLAKGAQLPIKVTVTRNPAYAGEIKLTIDKATAGMTAAEVVIPADKSEADLVLSAAADAAVGPAAELRVNAVSPANGKLTASAPIAGVIVE
ncbi:MAG: hypothetical protein DWH91_12000 [Planctomycetota bacterium]|nr:MAG: hypothetical protein DWH91_12000 [Planctomycetota bacterium]